MRYFIQPAGDDQRFMSVEQARIITRVYRENEALPVPLKRALALAGDVRTIPVPFTDQTVSYDAMPRIGVGISRLGASTAITLGAYAFSLSAT